MRIFDEIRIIDLLTRREAEFLRITECEEQIRALLGGNEYPFPPPPVVLPSYHRTHAKKAWRPQGIAAPVPAAQKNSRRANAETGESPAANAPPTGSLLPPLQAPGENAYLIHYLEKGKEGTSFLTDSSQVQSLLELACESFRVVKVDAVHFQTLGNYQILRTLWADSAG